MLTSNLITLWKLTALECIWESWWNYSKNWTRCSATAESKTHTKTTCAYIYHACEVVTRFLMHSVILQAILKLTDVNICFCVIVFDDYRLLCVCVCTCICAHAYIFKILKSYHKVSEDYKVPLLPQTITFVLLMCMQVYKKNACQCGTPFIHILHESSLTSVFLPCIATQITWKLTYFCLSALYCWVQSSNSFWFISIKSFSALYINPWIVLQQQNQHIYTYCRRRQVQSVCVHVCVCVRVHMRTHAYLWMSVCRHYYLYVYMTSCVGLSECLTTCKLTSAYEHSH